MDSASSSVVLGGVLVAALSGFGCSGDAGDRALGTGGGAGDSNVFGGAAGSGAPTGAGGSGAAASTSGASGSGFAASGGRCSAARPVSELRIDNFEDGDTAPVSEPERYGNWAMSEGDGQPAATFSVDEGGADGTDFAAHVTSDEFTENTLGLVLSTRVDGQGCPYNAAGTSGISLWVKGTGRIDLKVSTDEIFTLEWGGTCDETVSKCWDAHQKLIPLSDEWTFHEVRWTDLSQAGWGDSFPFDPSGLMNFLFASAVPGEPAEFWVDELRFVPDASGGGSE
ncbi:MAG TPA: hypothetical protein VF103_04815 [Polyangiaceae bacterium]